MQQEDDFIAAEEKSKLSNNRNVIRSKLTLQTTFLFVLSVIFTIFSWVGLSTQFDSRRLRMLYPSRVKCVLAMQSNFTRGLGAIIMRNHLAAFVASIEHVPLAFSPLYSTHGYDLGSFFSDCADNQTVPAECTVHHWKMGLKQCTRGDCKCISDQVSPHLAIVRRSCDTIRVESDGLLDLELSGCIRYMMDRQFGNRTAPPVEYDAIHFGIGDLKGYGLDSFSKRDLFCIVRAMCDLSDRPIVIITEGNPTVPHLGSCGRRIVLANDESIKESFRIIQHANNVAIGTSSLALAMMELATPERVTVMQAAAGFYEWVNCENWTVIGDRCEAFHFNSKKLMVERALRFPTMMLMGFGVDHQYSERNFSLQHRRNSGRRKTSTIPKKWR